MDYLNRLERILDGKHRLVSMESYDVERVLEVLGRLSRQSSKALYLWSPREGMRRLGAAHIAIPGTGTPRGLLQHIAESRHFGVYVLRGFNEALEDPSNQLLLKQIAEDEASPKVVMLLGEQVLVPQALKPLTLRSRHQTRGLT